jgi:hypothetical protein
VRGLLQTEPQNNQAKELERLIDKAMKKGESFCFVKPSAFPQARALWTPPLNSFSTPSLSLLSATLGVPSPDSSRLCCSRAWGRPWSGSLGGWTEFLTAFLLLSPDGLVGMAIVGGMALGVAGLAGLIGLAVSKSKS